MHNNKTHYTYPVLTLMVIVVLIAYSEAGKAVGVQHCNDKLKGLIMSSCKLLNSRQSRETHSAIVKRENEAEDDDDEEDISVEFLENETITDILKGHRLYNVRKSSFPEGVHLILSHHNAKLLREYDPKFKIYERYDTVYRNRNGRLEREQINRHRRNSQKRSDFHRLISACCFNSCLPARC